VGLVGGGPNQKGSGGEKRTFTNKGKNRQLRTPEESDRATLGRKEKRKGHTRTESPEKIAKDGPRMEKKTRGHRSRDVAGRTRIKKGLARGKKKAHLGADLGK